MAVQNTTRHWKERRGKSGTRWRCVCVCSRLNRVPCSSYNELWRIGMARGACV